MTEINDRLYYTSTTKGLQIDRLQAKIHEQLVSDCTVVDLIHALRGMNIENSQELMQCFRYSRTKEFYQLVTSGLYDYFLQQASDDAMRIGEIEY